MKITQTSICPSVLTEKKASRQHSKVVRHARLNNIQELSIFDAFESQKNERKENKLL